MAKIKKKRVSVEATKKIKKEKKGLLHSKLFWGCVGVVAAAAITLAIVLPIVLNQSNTTKEVPDYFGQTQEYTDATGTATEVKFNKGNYSTVLQHTNANKGNDGAGVENANLFTEYVIVFATDLSAFYPEKFLDSNGDDLHEENHEKAFKTLIQLQYEIDKYNKETNSSSVELFIVDTRDSLYSENEGILTDTSFGGSDNGSTLLFCLYTRDGIKKNYKSGENSEENLFATDYNGTLLTALNNLVNYIRLDFVEYEK